jgi:sulfite exporter TauE/SafE/copper chaperone CopZ
MGGANKRKKVNTLELRVGGMTCVNCQNRIERALKRTRGVAWARVSYADGRARVEYDPARTDARAIVRAIEDLGYKAISGGGKGKKRGDEGADTGAGSGLPNGLDARRVVGILIVVVAVFFILRNLGFTISLGNVPLAEEGMGYGLLFLIGLLTSVHCVAMCGGINISQCIPAGAGGGARIGEAATATGKAKAGSPGKNARHGADRRSSKGAAFAPSLKYNLARVCSYTAIGAAVGGIGSAVSLSGDMKGLIQLIAGVFMVVMGLSMFGVLPGISRIVPHMPRVFGDRIESAAAGGKGPVVVGLLNGFMPCGPLQAMQLFALSTGSPAQGALSMLCFSLGTAPLMFGLGALSSLLGGRFTSRAMIIGAALVIFLGLSMFTQGLTLSGVGSGAPGAGGGESGRTTELAEGSLRFGANEAAADDNPVSDDAAGAGAPSPSGDSYTDDEGNTYSDEDGVQVVRSTLGTWGYPHITVRADAPVRWIIDAPKSAITGCNGAIYIPEYEKEHIFEPGENVIEFTPEKPGEFMYSCWMGMITSTITVEA